MAAAETELDMVRRHVREGDASLDRHRALVAHLKANELPTLQAEALLAVLEDSQRQHEAHLARIEGRLG